MSIYTYEELNKDFAIFNKICTNNCFYTSLYIHNCLKNNINFYNNDNEINILKNKSIDFFCKSKQECDYIKNNNGITDNEIIEYTNYINTPIIIFHQVKKNKYVKTEYNFNDLTEKPIYLILKIININDNVDYTDDSWKLLLKSREKNISNKWTFLLLYPHNLLSDNQLLNYYIYNNDNIKKVFSLLLTKK
jgi:hypothetical protein